MKIVLNGSIFNDEENAVALSRLSSLLQEIEQKKLVVRSFKIDGVDCDFTPDDVLTACGGAELVEFKACSLPELLREALDDAKEYLPRLAGGLRRAAEHFVAGREGEGINIFLQALDGLNWLEQLNESVAGGGLASLPDGFLERLSGHRGSLADLLAAWENRDYLLVGDILDYEVAPYLDYFFGQLAYLNAILSGEKKGC